MTVQGVEAVCLLHEGSKAPYVRRGQCGLPASLPFVGVRGAGSSLDAQEGGRGEKVVPLVPALIRVTRAERRGEDSQLGAEDTLAPFVKALLGPSTELGHCWEVTPL